MPRPRKLDYRGEIELRKAAREGLTARQARDYLLDLWGEEKIGGEVPEVRALQVAMRKYRTDPSGAWAISQAAPNQIEVLTPVARAVLQETGGRERLTNREADFALRIHAAAPALKARVVWEYARSYILCEDRRESSDYLDLALTLQPLQGVDLAQTYARAIGGDFTSLMIETLSKADLFNVAQSWPADVEAGPRVAALNAEIEAIVDEVMAEREAEDRSKAKPSSTDGGRGDVDRKRESRKKEAPQ